MCHKSTALQSLAASNFMHASCGLCRNTICVAGAYVGVHHIQQISACLTALTAAWPVSLKVQVLSCHLMAASVVLECWTPQNIRRKAEPSWTQLMCNTIESVRTGDFHQDSTAQHFGPWDMSHVGTPYSATLYQAFSYRSGTNVPRILVFLGLGWNKLCSNRSSFHYLTFFMVLGWRSNTFDDFNDPRALLHVQNNNHHQTAAIPLEQSHISRQYHAPRHSQRTWLGHVPPHRGVHEMHLHMDHPMGVQ